jgi:stage V sporulation protein S
MSFYHHFKSSQVKIPHPCRKFYLPKTSRVYIMTLLSIIKIRRIRIINLFTGQGAGKMEMLKISANSKPKSVAGAIAAVLRNNGSVEVQAIGAGAVNQAVKSIAIARGYVIVNGIDLVCIPTFTKIEVNEEEKTAIKLLICSR